jgi:RNA 2',3'-cyclic 3'-phosphodiesterase
MRLFIGIELPEALKNSAAAAANRVRERIAHHAPGAQMRWVPHGNLHITIWFLGEVKDARGQALVTSMKEPLGTRPFTLHVAGAGAFPASGAPRAIWLGLVAGGDGLLSVHNELRPRLLPLGFEPEKRQFSPHLTIARVKDIRPSHAVALRKILRDVDDDVGECHISSATIFRSRPTPAGSEYEALSRVLFAG